MKVLNSPCIHVHYFIDLWHNTSLTVDNYVGKHCSYMINNNLPVFFLFSSYIVKCMNHVKQVFSARSYKTYN